MMEHNLTKEEIIRISKLANLIPTQVLSIAKKFLPHELERDEFVQIVESTSLLMSVGEMQEQEAINSIIWARQALVEII